MLTRDLVLPFLWGCDSESRGTATVNKGLAQLEEGMHLSGGNVGLGPPVTHLHCLLVLEPPVETRSS